MIRDDEHWLQLTDAFHAAAIEPDRWYGALSAFAGATDSQHGHRRVGAAANHVVILHGTVRAQIKALLAKAGVSRQVELVARLNQL